MTTPTHTPIARVLAQEENMLGKRTGVVALTVNGQDVFYSSRLRPLEDDEALADFIVRACISHAALVEAAERAQQLVIWGRFSGAYKAEAVAIAEQITAALRLAKEGQ